MHAYLHFPFLSKAQFCLVKTLGKTVSKSCLDAFTVVILSVKRFATAPMHSCQSNDAPFLHWKEDQVIWDVKMAEIQWEKILKG